MNWLAVDNGANVHITVFVLLFLGGLGFPIPEDLPLIFAGVAVEKGLVELLPMATTAYIGVLIGDQFLYFIGYRYGKGLIKKGVDSPWFPSLTHDRVRLVRDQWTKHRYWLIIAARHLFPIRAVTFLSAGTLHVPYIDFLIADAIAAVMSVGLMMGIGYFIGESLTPEVTQHLVDRAHYYIIALLLIIGIGYSCRRALLSLIARRRTANKQAIGPRSASRLSQSSESANVSDII